MANVTAVSPPESWLRSLARHLGSSGTGEIETRLTSSDAELHLLDDLVIKVHALRTDPETLARRLRLASGTAQLVPPLETRPSTAPDGRHVSVWPRVDVADPNAVRQPWAEAGVLLAGLHRTPPPPGLPRHGWPIRLARAVERAPAGLHDLGSRLTLEANRLEHPEILLHGDWHLGQLGRGPDGWRLLDVDDLGVGDPAWDLARPAGFWACGLLDDEAWHTFLDAYRDAGGPAIPAFGDPWSALDLPARCAVFVAAVRATRSAGDSDSRCTAEALLAACRRMAK